MKRKILIVDDDSNIRELFADTLISAGYHVGVAENAELTLEILKKEEFAVIFLDLKLFGMNGIELCRQIRKLNQVSIINAMTGWAALFEIEECREAGFDDYFVKPLRQETLLKAIEEAFDKVERWQERYNNRKIKPFL